MAYGCSKWTEPQVIDLGNGAKVPSEKYLEDLRAFKESEHKITIVTMNGIDTQPISQSQHLMSMPDSADYICIHNAVNLFPSIAQEVSEVYAKKGTRTICDVDYMQISNAWQAMEDAKEEGAPAGTEEEFCAYITENTELQLSCCDQYGLDGIMVSYTGNTVGTGKAGQEAFMAAVNKWRGSHPGKTMIFSGLTLNILDRNFFADCQYVIFPAGTEYSSGEITRVMQRYCRILGAKKNSVIVEVNVPCEEYPQQKGYDAQPVVAAQWVLEADSEYGRAGICVDNMADDYLVSGTYAITRKAITVMNPALGQELK
ncbi:MAG: glycoside hydrolase family 18 [Bacteroidales bacterium]|nr:glycoside hydrolase family 18 [Bacteroidales bacterium]